MVKVRHLVSCVQNGEETLAVTVRCPSCRDLSDLTVDKKGFDKWLTGRVIQEALPGLPDDEREQLISGVCPKCWNDIFGGER